MEKPVARIAVNLIQYNRRNKIIQNYAQSVIRELQALGHEVIPIGPGTSHPILPNGCDLLIDLDCGRHPTTGELTFIATENDKRTPIPSAVWFIDSHGNPTLHHRLAPKYNHVFFAVWSKRDLFVNHPSAHWCPNATDAEWFHPKYKSGKPEFDFGFFGSKMGLSRAEPMKEICENNSWSYDIRQVNKVHLNRWPSTAKAMGNCRILFNHGQKHDSPNLRVLESMAMELPLINDQDNMSGMDKLFIPGVHYHPYEYYEYKGLEDKMKLVLDHYDDAFTMATNAKNLVVEKHLIKNRVQQIMEIALAK